MIPAGWSFTRGISARLVFVQGPVGSCVAWAEPKAERNTHEAILFALAEALLAAPEAETSASDGGAGMPGMRPRATSGYLQTVKPDATKLRWEDDAPAAPVGDAELPPLPEPLLEEVDHELWGQNVKSDVWGAEQMRRYARVAQEPLEEEVRQLSELVQTLDAKCAELEAALVRQPGGEVRKPLTFIDAADWLEQESIRVYGSCLREHAEAANWLRERRIVATTTSDAGEQR